MAGSDLQVLPMTEADLEQIMEIEQAVFSLPWSKEGFADSLSQENTCYLTARFRDEIVGYCGFLQVLDEADITNVAVAKAFRRQKVAWSMLKELLRKGEERGVTAFTLEVRESNLGAISLYEKLGFENCGIRRGFYEMPKENAVIMWKR